LTKAEWLEDFWRRFNRRNEVKALSAGEKRKCSKCHGIYPLPDFFNPQTGNYLKSCSVCTAKEREHKRKKKEQEKDARRKELEQKEAALRESGEGFECAVCRRVKESFRFPILMRETDPIRSLACLVCHRERLELCQALDAKTKAEHFLANEKKEIAAFAGTDHMPEEGRYRVENGATVLIEKTQSIRDDARIREALSAQKHCLYGGIFTSALQTKKLCDECGRWFPKEQFWSEVNHRYRQLCPECNAYAVRKKREYVERKKEEEQEISAAEDTVPTDS
jgi:hypothetical protein